MSVTARANFAALQWPGIQTTFGMAYKEKPLYCNQIFDVKKSKKAYEEDLLTPGFGFVQIKTEGAAISYDSHAQGWKKRYQHDVYALGFIVTMEEDADNLYPEVQRQRPKDLARSFRVSKEKVCAAVLNRAFDSSYVGGDGKELCATDHPTARGGTLSNELAVAADLSEAAIEDAMVSISLFEDDSGRLIGVTAERLIVAPANMFNAERIIRSDKQSGTANNDVNAMRSMSMLPKGILAHPYLTDTDAWFLQTDVNNGLTMYQRAPLTFAPDNDFDTKNRKYAGMERYSVGWTDWRSVFGSPGA